MTREEHNQIKLAKLCEEMDRLVNHLEQIKKEQEELFSEGDGLPSKKEEALRK